MDRTLYYSEISFNTFVTAQPTVITFSYHEINLKFKVFVEWSN
ncbi:MAG: hypothetical protein O9282_06910 [Flavobacterium sp.]|nr:hypothetical protein [Flavobacterium sp.]MCZ8331024.1 hypothetical protein [Flavobacterium sp.]